MKPSAWILLAVAGVLGVAVMAMKFVRHDEQDASPQADRVGIADAPHEALTTLDEPPANVVEIADPTPAEKPSARVAQTPVVDSPKLRKLQREIEEFRKATGYMKYPAANGVLRTAIVEILIAQGRWEKAPPFDPKNAKEGMERDAALSKVGTHTFQINDRRYTYTSTEFPELVDVWAGVSGRVGPNGEVPPMSADLVARIEARASEAMALLRQQKPKK